MKREVQFNIKNLTGATLNLKSVDLDHGKWSHNGTDSPPQQIPNNHIGFFQAQKQTGSGYGVTGTVEYSTSEGNVYEFYFNNPYSGSNEEQVICDDDGSGTCSNYKITKMNKDFSNEITPSKHSETFNTSGQPYILNYQIERLPQ